VVKPAVPGCGVNFQRRAGIQVKLPRDAVEGSFELRKVDGSDGGNSHQDAVGRAQIQIGDVAVDQTALKFDAAFHHTHLPGGQRQGLQFLQTKRFKTRSSGGEKPVKASDNMAFDAFGQSGFRRHRRLAPDEFHTGLYIFSEL
jgi:hypothetical protein